MKILLIGSVPELDEVLSQYCSDIDLVVTSSKRHKSEALPYYQSIFSIDDQTSNAQMMSLVLKPHSTYHYSHILTFTDKWQLVVYSITQSLKMRCAIEPNPVSLCQDKKKFRDLMQSASLSSVWHTETTLQNLQTSLENRKFPYVIKPRTGQGSLGVKIIWSKNDVDNSLLELKSIGCNDVLVEAYVDGPEYSVEGFSLNGKHHILAITAKNKFNNTVVESGHNIPANLPNDVELKISTYVTKILNAIALTNGPSHTELIYTDHGPEVIESHCRIGGDKISVLVKHATGIDYCRLVVDNALQRSIAPSRLERTKSHFAAVRFIAIEDDQMGEFKGMSGIQEVIKYEHVIEVNVIKAIGDKIKKVTCSGDRVAYVMFSSTQPISNDIELTTENLEILLQ